MMHGEVPEAFRSWLKGFVREWLPAENTWVLDDPGAVRKWIRLLRKGAYFHNTEEEDEMKKPNARKPLPSTPGANMTEIIRNCIAKKPRIDLAEVAEIVRRDMPGAKDSSISVIYYTERRKAEKASESRQGLGPARSADEGEVVPPAASPEAPAEEPALPPAIKPAETEPDKVSDVLARADAYLDQRNKILQDLREEEGRLQRYLEAEQQRVGQRLEQIAAKRKEILQPQADAGSQGGLGRNEGGSGEDSRSRGA